MCADFYCGPKRIRRFFETEALAKAYEARELTSINDTGKLTKNKNLSRFLVRQIAEEYRDEEAPKHKGAKFEMSRIRTILKHEICKRTLAIVNKYDAGKYQQDRLATGISPPSVRREIGALVFVFSRAMTKNNTTVSLTLSLALSLRGARSVASVG
jgi:hypothetical protein